MRDARFQIPGPALLAKVVDKLDKLDTGDRDTKGDVYEYMLAKIATAGQNGQFRTPRHIIAMMVELVAPRPDDVICDPACGTCGFLVAAGEYLRKHHAALFQDDKLRRHFNDGLFNGFDFDPTMLRIGSMNMALHGVEGANVTYRDSLAEDHAEDAAKYSVVLANPPFAGALDYEATAKNLQRIVKTKKTELLFLALFLRLLRTGGRAAVIVPDGVLFGSSKAHKDLRRLLVEEEQARRGDQAAVRRVPAVRRGLDCDPCLHPHRHCRQPYGLCLVLRRARRRLVAGRQAPAASF
jgi:type I restriction enzyme M protein